MIRDTTPLESQLKDFITDGAPEDVVALYESLPRLAREGEFGVFDENVVVLDTETTGFSLNHDELTQIAAARVERGEIVEWFTTFVNPGKPIPEEVAHLTNIHDSDVAHAPSPSEALTLHWRPSWVMLLLWLTTPSSTAISRLSIRRGTLCWRTLGSIPSICPASRCRV